MSLRRNAVCLSLAIAGLIMAGAVQAQEVCRDGQTGQVNPVTTRNWQSQIAMRDAQLMAQLAGIWQAESEVSLPGVTGGTERSTTRSTLHAQGTFVYDRYSCYSVPGLGTSCPQTSGYGSWAAHRAQDGSIFLGTNISSALMQNICGGSYVRLVDGNTMIGINGSVSRRIQ